MRHTGINQELQGLIETLQRLSRHTEHHIEREVPETFFAGKLQDFLNALPTGSAAEFSTLCIDGRLQPERNPVDTGLYSGRQKVLQIGGRITFDRHFSTRCQREHRFRFGQKIRKQLRRQYRRSAASNIQGVGTEIFFTKAAQFGFHLGCISSQRIAFWNLRIKVAIRTP